MTTALIVPAAGRGERLGTGRPKALHELAGEPLLVHALRSALASGAIDVVAIAAPPGAVAEVRDVIRPVIADAIVVQGGADRRRSVAAALTALPDGVECVLVHDAARCLTPPEVFVAVAKRIAEGADAVVPVLPVADTVKQVDGGRVVATPDRSSLRIVQTPQGFRHDVLVDAHATVADDVTDDAGMVERRGRQVHVVAGHEEAFKVTTRFDLVVAAAVLARRGADS